MELFEIISREYHSIELDSSIFYAKKSITLAEKLNEYHALMRLSIDFGIALCFKGDYDEALDYLDRSNRLAIEHKNKEMEAFSLSSTGFAYAKQGKHNIAIDYYLKYLKISESEGWIVNCVRALINLGEINRRLGNPKTAILYLKQAEEICNQRRENAGLYHWWIPQIYNEYAFNYLSAGDYDKALYYASRADSINVPAGTINLCYTKGLLASAYLCLNNHDFALHAAYYLEKYSELNAKYSEKSFHTIVSDMTVKYNSIKHSGATNINLQLVQSSKHVSLTVVDDGCGFDEKTVTKGNGLENIRNRVASFKGKIDIISSPDKGTETIIEMRISG